MTNLREKLKNNWTETRLGKVVEIKTGKKDANHGSSDGKFPFFTCSKKVSKISNYSFDKEAVLVAGNGDFNVKYYVGKFDAYQRTYILSNFKNSLGKYIYYKVLQALSEIIKNNQGSSVKFIKKNDLENYKLFLPLLKQQEQIVEILSKVDEDIEATDEIIKKTEKLKKGLMQELLTKGIGHKKFKKTKLGMIPEEWKVKKGKEISRLVTKGASPKWQGFEYQESGTLFITSENVRSGYLDISSKKFLPLEFHQKLKNSQLKKGDMLINIVGASIGRSCLFNQEIDNANINQAVCLFRTLNEVESSFICQYLQSPKNIQRLLDSQGGSARQNLSLTDIKNFLFLIPPINEQKEIAKILSKVDKKIEIYQENKRKLEILKKGLMQDLLE